MTLHRYILRPLSAWITPLRSDTLSGLLLYRLAEDEGEAALHREIEEFLQGRPPFALSSAMPQGMIFAPRLAPLPRVAFASLSRKGYFTAASRKPLSLFEALNLYKKFRKKRYLPLAIWEKHFSSLSVDKLFVEFCQRPRLWESPVQHKFQEMHVTIARNSNSALEGGLFPRQAFWPAPNMAFHLYAETEDGPRLLERLKRIGMLGFGKDCSTGKGVFAIEEDTGFVPPRAGQLPHGLLLSMLASESMSGMKGWYSMEVKTGKVGPAFSRGNPYKSPFLCVQEGAVLKSLPKGPFVLRGLNANPDIVQITQPLCLPCRMDEEVNYA